MGVGSLSDIMPKACPLTMGEHLKSKENSREYGNDHCLSVTGVASLDLATKQIFFQSSQMKNK